MIKRIFSAEELEKALTNIPADVLRGKVKALAESYGFSYSFLKFYEQAEPSAVIAVYYGSAIICGAVTEEAVSFLVSGGTGEILMPECKEEYFGLPRKHLNIMEYSGARCGNPEMLLTDTPYNDVYEILKDGFEIDFEEWYTDTCHNARHGISEVFTLENKATAQKMFTVDGISLISLVAVKKEHRGEGLGGRIVRAVSDKLSEKGRVYVICEAELIPFYEKNGYILKNYCTQIKLT